MPRLEISAGIVIDWLMAPVLPIIFVLLILGSALAAGQSPLPPLPAPLDIPKPGPSTGSAYSPPRSCPAG